MDDFEKCQAFLKEDMRVIISQSEQGELAFGTSSVSFWYSQFMPKLLSCCTVCSKEDAKREIEAVRDEMALDAWHDDAKRKGEFEPYGRDVVECWDRLKGDAATKTCIQRSWRLTRHYLNGPQKAREREGNGAGHRSSGDLSQYVAFIDVCMGRSYVSKAQMRLSFPYFIGNAVWRWKHTIAEIACSGSEETEKNICSAFGSYFRLFAAMYACPYCRGHLNVYVINTREVWAYPIEYTLLGWQPKSDGDVAFHTVTLEDKLHTVSSGGLLRLFLWKLHNAVNSSIARQEKWFHADNEALYTSRWWPNIDSVLLRSKFAGLGLIPSDTQECLVEMLKVCTKMSEERDELLEKEDENLETALKTLQPLLLKLDGQIEASGFLQRTYAFDVSLEDGDPLRPTENEEAWVRSEDFTDS